MEKTDTNKTRVLQEEIEVKKAQDLEEFIEELVRNIKTRKTQLLQEDREIDIVIEKKKSEITNLINMKLVNKGRLIEIDKEYKANITIAESLDKREERLIKAENDKKVKLEEANKSDKKKANKALEQMTKNIEQQNKKGLCNHKFPSYDLNDKNCNEIGYCKKKALKGTSFCKEHKNN